LSALIWGTVAAIILVLLVPPLFRGTSHRQTTGANLGQTATAAGAGRISPDPYRDEILALEQRLFSDSPSSYDDAGEIAGLATRLSVAVRGDGRDPRRRRAYGQLFDYAGVLNAMTDVGYAALDLVDARSRWEPTRDSVFVDAPWFSRASEGLTRSQTPLTTEADPSVVRQLNEFVSELEALIRDGRRAALEIPEAGVDGELNTREARYAENRWRAWSEGWSNQLNTAVRFGPRSLGTNPDVIVTLAYQELQNAVRELQLVPSTAATTTTIPFTYEREQRFASAAQFLQSAKAYLAKLGR
jgi:hypothetical protein